MRKSRIAVFAAVVIMTVGGYAVAKGVSANTANKDNEEVREVLTDTHVADLTGGDMSGTLDRIIDPPNVIGWVRGTVVSDARQAVGVGPFFDYEFRLTEFYGPNNPGYSRGDLITLRVQARPTDSTGTEFAVDESAPIVTPGTTLFAIVYGLNTLGNNCGGNTLDRICVFYRGFDVFELHGDVVRGQGRYSNFAENEHAFIRHFNSP